MYVTHTSVGLCALNLPMILDNGVAKTNCINKEQHQNTIFLRCTFVSHGILLDQIIKEI